MYRIRYPMTMLGRRASGKTSLLSVLKGKGGFESKETKISYLFNSSDEVTKEKLQSIYDRILKQENPNPTSADTLNECLMYADANSKRIDFNIPDIAGEWFEKKDNDEKNSEYLEIFEKFQDLLSKSGSLIVLISYDELASNDFKYITEPITKALDTLKKKDRGIVPFIVVAVTKFDLCPDFKKDDFEHNKKLLEKLIEDNAEFQPIKAMVCGAAGKENSALIPVSVYGSNEKNEDGEMIPPKIIEPIGLVELFECAFKCMIIQNAKYEFDNSEKDLDNALYSLKGLLGLSPYEEINKDIQEKIDIVKGKIKKKSINRIKIITAIFVIILSFLLYQFVLLPKQIRNAHYASGQKMLSGNVDDMKLITDWIFKIDKYLDRDKEMRELYTSVLAKYDSKLADGIITKIDSELDKTPEENEKIRKIRLFKEENKSLQLVQNHLIMKEAEIVKKLNDSAIKLELEKLSKLPFEKRIEEIYSMLENNNQQITDLNEKLRERLNNEEQIYFDKYFKKYIEDFNAKKLHNPGFYLEFKANCTKYLDIFKLGKNRDACNEYISWVNSFEKDGIILKQVTMNISFPSVSGYDSHWDVFTPFGNEDFNTNKDKTWTFENCRFKLDSTYKPEFSAYLKDKDWIWGTHDPHIEWSPVKKDECLIFNFSIVLPNSNGNIKMSFDIKMDDQDERLYEQAVSGFK